MKALIVDDEQHVLDGLKAMIPWRELGITELILADSGAEAWERYNEHQPDLIVTDMYMKEMNGIELIKRIRAVNAEVPILILSGYDDFSYAKEAIHFNVSSYILKPSLPEEIEREIRDTLEALNQKRRQSAMFADLQQRIERNIPILREQLLHQLLTTGLRREELSADKLAFYQLDPRILDSGLVVSAKLYPSGRDRPIDEREWQIYKFAASNIAEELAADQQAYVLRFIDDRLPILFCAESPGDLEEHAREFAAALIESIQHYLRLDINVGLGQAYSSLSHYALSLKESVRALELGEMEGLNQVFAYASTNEHTDSAIHYPIELISSLCEALSAADWRTAKTIWSEIRHTLTVQGRMPLANLQIVCSGILTNVIQRVMETCPSIMDSHSISSLLQELYRYRSFDELMDWMEGQIRFLHTRLVEQTNRQSGLSYVEYVKKAVAENYHSKISFAELAKELNINRNYLSNLFTAQTGTNFITYLSHCRINKAKALLMKKRHTVYEVAEMVGYSDPAYFCRVFKNITGLTPLEYVLSQEE